MKYIFCCKACSLSIELGHRGKYEVKDQKGSFVDSFDTAKKAISYVSEEITTQTAKMREREETEANFRLAMDSHLNLIPADVKISTEA